MLFDADELSSANRLSLDEIQARGSQVEIEQPDLLSELTAAAKPDDLATIIYTSGTTGEPKGVMLTHSNMVSNLIDSSNHLEFGEKDSALSVLPLSHGFERQAMNMYLRHGMSVFFGQSLNTIGADLREVHPTVFVGVPRIYLDANRAFGGVLNDAEQRLEYYRGIIRKALAALPGEDLLGCDCLGMAPVSWSNR